MTSITQKLNSISKLKWNILIWEMKTIIDVSKQYQRGAKMIAEVLRNTTKHASVEYKSQRMTLMYEDMTHSGVNKLNLNIHHAITTQFAHRENTCRVEYIVCSLSTVPKHFINRYANHTIMNSSFNFEK